MRMLCHFPFAAVLATACASSTLASESLEPTPFLTGADSPAGFVSGAMPNEDASARPAACAALANSAEREPDWYARICHSLRDAPLLPAAPAPRELGDLAYQINMRAGDGPTFESVQDFLLPDAGDASVIGPQPLFIYGLEFDHAAGILWAITELNELGQVDTSTGALMATAPMSGIGPNQILTGLAFIDGESTFYLSTSNGAIAESFLYTVDPTTGAASLVGAMGVSFMIDIAINAEGAMYGHSVETNSIYSIDIGTGSATLIGPTGYDANFAQAIEFDKSTGVLYAWLYQGGGVNTFATIDLSTGLATSVASPLPGEYEGTIASVASLDIVFKQGFEGP